MRFMFTIGMKDGMNVCVYFTYMKGFNKITQYPIFDVSLYTVKKCYRFSRPQIISG